MIARILLYCLIFVLSAQTAISDEYTELIVYRDLLKQQIEATDAEIARCEKSLKGWKTATILGGIGALASGIGIIAQKNQIDKNQEILNKNAVDFQESNDAINFIQKVNE